LLYSYWLFCWLHLRAIVWQEEVCLVFSGKCENCFFRQR
jgi:hypothetical protein